MKPSDYMAQRARDPNKWVETQIAKASKAVRARDAASQKAPEPMKGPFIWERFSQAEEGMVIINSSFYPPLYCPILSRTPTSVSVFNIAADEVEQLRPSSFNAIPSSIRHFVKLDYMIPWKQQPDLNKGDLVVSIWDMAFIVDGFSGFTGDPLDEGARPLRTNEIKWVYNIGY